MKDKTENSPDTDVAKLGELIHGIKIAMLTTASPSGELTSRPMQVQEVAFDGDLWFFTSRSSGKCETLQSDPHVNLAFVAARDSRYISVAGLGELVDDSAKTKELWSPIMKAWFPKGMDDPDLVLLKVKVQSAEYWDTPSSPVVQLIGFAKAVATGERYKPSPQEHAKLNLNH